MQNLGKDDYDINFVCEKTTEMEDRPEERNEEIEKPCPDAADVILSVILNNPGEFERNEPPMAVRSNFMCTFNLETVPIERAKADGNGAYIHSFIHFIHSFHFIQNSIHYTIQQHNNTYYNKRLSIHNI